MTIDEWRHAHDKECPVCGRSFEESDDVTISDDLVETWGTDIAHSECLRQQERPRARPWF